MADNQDIKPIITPQGSINVERLPSFRIPRDLTLGGSNAVRRGGLAPNRGKKIFTPNLNVQRSKPKEETKVKEEPVPKDRNARGQSSRARGDRGRGRTIIQSSGIFAEGMGPNMYKSKSRSSGGSGDGGSSEAVIMKPKVDIKATIKVDVKEEEARLKLLLRDDFIDDPEPQGTRVTPIQLPVSSKLLDKTSVKKEELKEEENENGMTVPGIKIKKESVDEITKSEDANYDGKERLLIDYLRKKEPELILLQLPDCLPGLRPEKPKQAPSTSAGTSTDNSEQQEQCTLSTLPESPIGIIEILKSGAARLRFGESTFPIFLGTQTTFRQDVVAVELDESSKSGDMINLGSIKCRMTAPPDLDKLLLNSNSVGNRGSS